MSDNAGPSNEPVSVVEQFAEVCGVETTVARSFLEQSEWNLEQAIQQYFQAVELNANNDQRRPSSNASNAVPHNQPQVVARTAVNYGEGLTGWIRWLHHYFVTVPLELFYSSVTNVITFLYILLGNHRLQVTDPRGDVRKFLEDIVSKQVGRERVTFVNGSYDDALRRAKRNVQCLLVYLHSPVSPQCDEFLRSHVLTDQFRVFLQSNDCLLWGASTSTPEGKRVAMALHLVSYPALALITCVPGGRMACIARLSGNESLGTPAFFNVLQAAFDENRPHLAPMIREKAELERNSKLIREQESDYARALAADRAKREVQFKREAEQKAIEAQAREELERVEAKRRKLAEIRDQIRAQIPPQPISMTNGTTTPTTQKQNGNIVGGTICVRMKFPNGQSHKWNFDGAASLEELFNVVLTHKDCPDDFSLVVGYPPKALNCAPEWYREFSPSAESTEKIQTFEEAGLHKSVVVLVRDNDA